LSIIISLTKNPSNLLAAATAAASTSSNNKDLPVDNNNTRSTAVLSKRLSKDEGLLSIEIYIY
jgi:hypothetical protein